MNILGFVKQPKAKCKTCGKIWNIYGKPTYTDMMGFITIDICSKMYNSKSKDGMKCKELQ